MTPEELAKIIEAHGKWLSCGGGGERANLSCADLHGANLRGADLSGAYLSGANLSGAYLSGARGLNPYAVQPLLMLLDQPGKMRAYKLVNDAGEGPFNGGVKYEIGDSVKIVDADDDSATNCGAGINVATLDWCIKNWRQGLRILIVEFERGDIAVIPTASDGKFRLRRCDVVAEKDLAEIGLVECEKE